MKRVHYIIITILVSFSCQDYLEEDNQSGLTTENYYNTPAGYEDLINACYFPMRFWYGKEDGHYYTMSGTDIYTAGVGNRATPMNDYSPELQGALPVFDQGNNRWEELYRAVNTTNASIARVGDSGLPEALQLIRTGEARFLRAFYYWHIVETWGAVYLTTEETGGVVTEINSSPVEDFYNVIFQDLEFAIGNLPETTDEYGRITKPIAEAFMARMLLTRDRDAEAAEMAKQVINNYNYRLLENYVGLWDINNIVNDEVIFAVQYSEDLALSAGGNQQRNGGNQDHLWYLPSYDRFTGVSRTVENGRPFARFAPTRFFLQLFDREKDARFDAQFQTVWFYDDEPNIPPPAVLGDTAAFFSPNSVPDDLQASKPYIWYDTDDFFNPDGSLVKTNGLGDRFFIPLTKHLDPLRADVQQVEGRRDAFVIRLAEMYLIVAEAAMKTGNMGEAVEYMNTLRRRAAKPGFETDMEITVADLDIDFILDERARELAGEYTRWFDLKRTGKLVERVRLHNMEASPNIQDFHSLRPIPQTQLDRTLSGNLSQNPGYN